MIQVRLREWVPNPIVRERLGNVTTFVDDVMNACCLLPEVLLLPPPNSKSGEDEAPAKMPTFSYYDQIWVYSELEYFKSEISKEDFMVISNLQRTRQNFLLWTNQNQFSSSFGIKL